MLSSCDTRELALDGFLPCCTKPAASYCHRYPPHSYVLVFVFLLENVSLTVFVFSLENVFVFVSLKREYPAAGTRIILSHYCLYCQSTKVIGSYYFETLLNFVKNGPIESNSTFPLWEKALASD